MYHNTIERFVFLSSSSYLSNGRKKERKCSIGNREESQYCPYSSFYYSLSNDKQFMEMINHSVIFLFSLGYLIIFSRFDKIRFSPYNVYPLFSPFLLLSLFPLHMGIYLLFSLHSQRVTNPSLFSLLSIKPFSEHRSSFIWLLFSSLFLSFPSLHLQLL